MGFLGMRLLFGVLVCLCTISLAFFCVTDEDEYYEDEDDEEWGRWGATRGRSLGTRH